jgi:hypothetical protein
MFKRNQAVAEARRLLNETPMRTFLPVFAIAIMAGCTGDLVELTAGSPDMSAGAAADMAQAGGGELGPSSVKFSPDIQMDLDAKGCTSVACHGTSGNNSVMYIKPMATAQADIDMNYMDVMNEINTTSPAQSPLLIQPGTAGSGHVGGMVLTMGTSDPTYIKWLAWIQAGAPKQ